LPETTAFPAIVEEVTDMKKSSTALTLSALLLVTLTTIGLIGRSLANAENLLLSESLWSSATATTTAVTGVVLPKTNIYFLTSDNMIYLLKPGSSAFVQLGRVSKSKGNLIGIDFRVADGNNNQVYGLTDTGNLLLIDLRYVTRNPTVVSTLSPRFAGGFQSLFDFNPVVNAGRIIGSNDQNFAVVNSNGNLNMTAVQTALTYAAADVNGGIDPNVSGGTYTNNVVGAANTIFYAVDYDLDTFVTISTRNATGSSNTGGGVLQTIGKIVNSSGNPINVNPTVDIDVFTSTNGNNSLVGINNETIFTIDLAQINLNLPLGTTQNVIARTVTLPAILPADSFIDIAIAPPAAAPAPTPTPTPTPAPVGGTYQAESASLGGGSVVNTNFPGFTGTGFVNFADNVAGGSVQFSVTQSGNRKLTFRYANGSTVKRPCALTVNGVKVDTLYFQPTGAWTNWVTVSTVINLGSGSGVRVVKLTASTPTGGPNLDRLDIR
jgi:Domain of unknown function (DUF4394)/Carbohydrate binding module (family 6)